MKIEMLTTIEDERLDAVSGGGRGHGGGGLIGGALNLVGDVLGAGLSLVGGVLSGLGNLLGGGRKHR